jgi:hypothetical protein
MISYRLRDGWRRVLFLHGFGSSRGSFEFEGESQRRSQARLTSI